MARRSLLPPQLPAEEPHRNGSHSPQPLSPNATKPHLANLDNSTPPSSASRSNKRLKILDSPSSAAGDEQCTRSNGQMWRCPHRQLPGRRFCEKHHKANVDRANKQHPSPKEKPMDEVPKSSKPPETETEAKTINSFKVGEVWALPDNSGLPRHYARIERFIPEPGLAVLTPLVHHPVSDEEIEWSENGHTFACGTFRACCNSTTVKEIKSLSYQVACFDVGDWKPKSFFKIYPRSGEVWSVYDDRERGSGYHLAEIVSGYVEDAGVTAARLVAVEGSAGVYRRQLHQRYELLRTFRKEEILWFSHQVMAFRDGKDNGIRGLWKVISQNL